MSNKAASSYSLTSVRTLATVSLLAASIHSAWVHAEEATQSFDGEVLVVTGSRIEQKLEDVVGSVSVITDAQIEQQMVTNLDDMFRYDPSITTTGNGASPQALNVRGIGGNRLVYIKDGRRLNDSYAGGTGLIVGRNNFDVADIKQLEVAKGAASSLYGSDGLGGIVVITTKDPIDYLNGEDSYLRLGTSYIGNSEQLNANVAAAKDLGKWKASISATQRSGHEVQNFAETLPGYDADSSAVTIKAQRKLNDTSEVKFTLDVFTQEREQIITAGVNQVNDEDTSWAFSGDYHSSAATSFYDQWQAQVYFSSYEQQSDAIAPGRGAYTDFNRYDFEQDIIGLRGLFNKSITLADIQHDIVYGIDFDQFDTTRPRLKTRVNADGSVEFSNQPQATFPGADTIMSGVFIQDTMQISPNKLSLILGGRLDYYSLSAKDDPLYDQSDMQDIDETAFSPKVALQYKFDGQWSSYIQYVQGFKIPPHDQAYQSHGVEPFYQILPNADLAPEESESYELGIRYYGADISVNANVFYAEFDNFIESAFVRAEPTFIPGVTKSYFQYQNIDAVTIEGAELGVTVTPNDNLSITAQATYLDGENDSTGQHIESLSPLQGSLLATYSVEQFAVTAAWRVADNMTKVPVDTDGNDLITSAGYGVVDLFGQYDGGNWTLTARIDNIFDKEYVPYQNIAGQAVGTDTNQFTQPGRNISLGATYSF